MEHIGVIVHSYAVKGLGCGIVTLFKGVHEYVDERIDHKSTQEQECRQEIEPGFQILLFHRISAFLETDAFFGVGTKEKYFCGL